MNKKVKNAFLHPLVLAAIVGGIISVPTTLLTILGGENKLSRLLIRANDIDNKLNFEAPPGTIVAYAGSIDDERKRDLNKAGWLLCDGKFVPDGKQYEALKNVLARYWGPGDGYNNVSVPNLQGLFLRGVDPDGKNDPDFTNRLSAVDNKQHFGKGDVGSYQPDTVGKHVHPYADGQPHATKGDKRDEYLKDRTGRKDAVYSLDEPRATGSNEGRETRPKNAYVYYIIKY